MPTYICSISRESIDNKQKAAIARAIAQVHSEETGAPTYFVQVVFEEKGPADRYLGGSRASRHVWVRGDIRAGRTEAQRNALMLGIMQVVSKITGVKTDDVWVYLNNLAPTDMVEYGHVLPLPGKEAEWFDTLPKALKEYLKTLGTSGKTFKL